MLAAHNKALLADLLARIRKEDGLRKRFDLLLSLPGVGKTIAAVLLIPMPELSAMARAERAGGRAVVEACGQAGGRLVVAARRYRRVRMTSQVSAPTARASDSMTPTATAS